MVEPMAPAPGRARPIVLHAQDVDESGSSRVRRLFPTLSLQHLDPFVVLDEFHLEPPASVPPSRHGFEAVTYVLEGALHHRDSLGNDDAVAPGGVQRFTAGLGVDHAQAPHDHAPSRGLRLWVNVPGPLAGVQSDFQQIEPEELPEERSEGVVVRTIVGDGSPTKLMTPVRYLDVRAEAGSTYEFHIPEGWNGFAYVLSGRVVLADEELPEGSAGVSDSSDLVLRALEDCHMVIIAGQPHRQHSQG